MFKNRYSYATARESFELVSHFVFQTNAAAGAPAWLSMFADQYRFAIPIEVVTISREPSSLAITPAQSVSPRNEWVSETNREVLNKA